MTGFRNWLGKLFGLRTAVEDQVVEGLEAAAKLGGVMGRFEMAKVAEEFAAELEASHPHLATAFRTRVADSLGLPTPVPAPATLDPSPAPSPPALPEAAPKKSPGRTKKAAAEPGTGPTGSP